MLSAKPTWVAAYDKYTREGLSMVSLLILLIVLSVALTVLLLQPTSRRWFVGRALA